MFTCEFCWQICKTSSSYTQHRIRCSQNPNKVDMSYMNTIEYKEKVLRGFESRGVQKLKDSIDLRQINLWWDKILKTRNCKKCNKRFTYIEREKKDSGPLHCSSKCSHSRVKSEITKLGLKVSCSVKVCLNSGMMLNRQKNTTCSVCWQIKKENCTDLCSRLQLITSLVSTVNFDYSVIWTVKVFSEFERVKDELFFLYNIKEFSCNDLKNHYKCSKSSANFSTLLNHLGITRRSRSNARVVSVEKYGIYEQTRCKYQNGHLDTKLSWNVYYRSSYELDLITKLDNLWYVLLVEWLRIPYIYEDKKHIAIPDIYIPTLNLIIEIKSAYGVETDWKILEKKLETYRSLGYKTLLVVDKEYYVGRSNEIVRVLNLKKFS